MQEPIPLPPTHTPTNPTVPSLYLKSGMPLGVLMPAPATTTMFWNDSVLIAVATSSRDFTFLSLFPPTVNIPLLHFQGKINKYENYYVICEIHVSCLICIYNENIFHATCNKILPKYIGTYTYITNAIIHWREMHSLYHTKFMKYIKQEAHEPICKVVVIP